MKQLVQKQSWLTSVSNKGQATTELAIMGMVVLMAMLFMAKQGFIYNARQGLEMYAFRQALSLSKQSKKGVNLLVIRDIVLPSFFSSLDRQRIQSSVAVEANPWDAYNDEPDTLQFFQIGEAMIQNDNYINVPATKINAGGHTQYIPSQIRGFDLKPQPVSQPSYAPLHTEEHTYVTKVFANKNTTFEKNLTTHYTMPLIVSFKNATEIQDGYTKEGEGNVAVDGNTIPKDIVFYLNETVNKKRTYTAD